MMKTLLLLCMICVTGSFAQLSATMTCTPTSYSFEITGTTPNGHAYIENECDPISTSSGSTSLTFAAADCTAGSLPAIGSTFTFVVQKNAGVETSSSLIVSCTCTKDLTPITEVVTGASVTNEDSEGTVTNSLAPTFTLGLEDGNGVVLTSGVVGTSAVLKVTMDEAYRALYDHQITAIVANSLSVVSGGCSIYDDIPDANSASSNGEVSWNHELFKPYGTPSRSETTVSYTITIGVCDGTCATQTCDTRKRRDLEEEVTNSTTLQTSVLVYPIGSSNNLGNKGDNKAEENVCVSRTPLTIALAGLALGMVVCLFLTICMFVRMRKNNKQNKADDTYARHNVGFKH